MNYLPIIAYTLAIFAIGEWLVYLKKLPMLAVRKFWNAVLLLSFIVCAVTSIAYLLRSESGINLGIENVFQLHLLSGSVMIGVAIAHFLWHVPYYLAYFKKG